MGLERLNEIKKSKGLTNEQLAEMSGVPKTTLDKITAGTNTNPKLGTLQSLCRALGCRLDDLDDLSPETKKPPHQPKPARGEISLEESNALLVALGYIKPGEQISDDDLAFLGHVIGLLDAWFDKGH